MKKHIVALTLVAVLGAGCPRTPDAPIQIPSLPETSGKTPASHGFGMLPALGAPSAVLGTPEAISARPMAAIPPASPMPMMEGMAREVAAPTITTGSVNVSGDAKLIARPYPMPQPAKVTYSVSTTLPTWETEADVLRGRETQLPSTGVKSLALATGLPSNVLGQNPNLRSFNVTWKDSESLTWSFDSMGRTLSFWSDMGNTVMDAAAGAKIQRATLSDEEVLAIAGDFMTRHGLGTYARSKPVVDHPWNAGDDIAPCPLPVEKMPVDAPATTDAKMMIAPCGGYYPIVTSVTYPLMVDGKEVYDAWGGPTAGISLQVDFNAKRVTNGYIWLTPETDSSKYPLITQQEALKRLSAGGRNPLYYYAPEVKEANVTIDAVRMVLMRYDSWTNDGTQTFFLPALYATGKTDLGNGKSEEYRTVVPLVSDDSFGGATPPPMIMPMTEPAAAVAPATPTVAPQTR